MSNLSNNSESMNAAGPAVATLDEREIAEYRALVSRLMSEVRRGAGSRGFQNKGVDHAKIVVDTMIDSAEQSICVYANQLSNQVYSADKIKAFLARRPGGSVTVAIEDARAFSSTKSALVDLKAEIAADRIQVTVAKHPFVNRNVCIVDGIFVRQERNQLTREAAVVFGNAEVGNQAQVFFRFVQGVA